MMQKLFSQEIRFKDEQGRIILDWEEKEALGEQNYLKSVGSQVLASAGRPTL